MPLREDVKAAAKKKAQEIVNDDNYEITDIDYDADSDGYVIRFVNKEPIEDTRYLDGGSYEFK